MTIRLNPNNLPALLASINRSFQNLTVAVAELSSGRSVNQLSDNPAAVATLVGNHDQASQDDQFLQNIDTLQSRFGLADTTLGSVVTALDRALSLGTEGANGTLSATDRQAIASELQGLISQVQSLANTSFQGSYLFSGTAVTTQPFAVNTVANTTTYNGNAGVASIQLSSGNSVSANVPGDQLFLNPGGNVFSALQGLSAALISGNNIPAAVTQIGTALSTVSTQRVFHGNILNQVSRRESFLSQDKINLSSQENALIAADPAKAATDFSQAQLANQGVLNATGRILSLPTLLDFLK